MSSSSYQNELIFVDSIHDSYLEMNQLDLKLTHQIRVRKLNMCANIMRYWWVFGVMKVEFD